MASIFSNSLNGVFPPHRKNTRDAQTQEMPIPDVVYMVMTQHMGPSCEVLVKPKDEVKVGQVIGDTDAFLSAPVHSSVSGTVVKIDQIILPNGDRSKMVVIQTDKQQELHPDVKPPVVKSKDDFIKAVRASGMVGLGGAGFPTHVKLNPKNLGEIDSLIINAAECEPYITSDYRTLIEDGEDVVAGIKAAMKYLGIPKCYIGIEDNKPDGIAKMKELTSGNSEIEVVALKSKYPQGAEKVLIYETVHRVVPEGKLPADVGAIVVNCTTIAKIAEYLKTGMPLVTKRVTVDGGAVKEPKNVLVPVGTPFKDVFAFCGGYTNPPKKILMGGPMMGIAVYNEDYPVLKNNNAVLAFDQKQVEDYDEMVCIRCGRCVRTCPFNLMPLRIEDAFRRDDVDGLREFKVNLCMECGCCAYACPSKRHLVQTNRLGKARLRREDNATKKS